LWAQVGVKKRKPKSNPEGFSRGQPNQTVGPKFVEWGGTLWKGG